jgi:SulP family sulfate permease
MRSTGFEEDLGADHFLTDDEAIPHLFHRILDPAICIYECEARAFRECQNLPRRTFPDLITCRTDILDEQIDTFSPPELWQKICDGTAPLIVDVREPREFRQGRVPQAHSVPLPCLLAGEWHLPHEETVILVCRSGRRSRRAACVLHDFGYENVAVLEGGMVAWEAACLLEALD